MKTHALNIKEIWEIETIALIALGVGVSLFFVMHNQQQNNHMIAPLSPSNTSAVISMTPTPEPKEEMSSQISPDGTKNLVMKTKFNTDGTITYTFSAINVTDNVQQQIYSTTVSADEHITIPFNTWSPDNRYVFLVKNDKDAMVFNASGTNFPDGETFLDATDAFNARNTGNILQEVTGWASPTLLVLNTVMADNTKGPSYWFEVPSKAIIRLSTEF